MTTCNSALITWTYSPVTTGDPLELTLYITNVGVAQLSAPAETTTGTFSRNVARAVDRRDSLTDQITPVPINPALRAFTWSSVNVTKGWYAIIGAIPSANFNQLSTSFYVENGADVSCLSSSSSSSPSSTPSPTGSPTSSGDTSSTSGVTPPVTSRSSKVNRGAIAGGVVGGLAVVAVAIAAYLYLRYASASRASRASPNWVTRKRADLGSTDSQAAFRSAGVGSDHHHSQSDSIVPTEQESKQPIIMRWVPPELSRQLESASIQQPESVLATQPESELATQPESSSASASATQPEPASVMQPQPLPTLGELAAEVQRLKDQINGIPPPSYSTF
jgi:hypothetical protein